MSSGLPRALFWSASLATLIATAWWLGTGDVSGSELVEVETGAPVGDGDVRDRTAAPDTAEGADQSSAAVQPIPDREPQSIPDTEVRVIRADTCAPLAGAEVFVLDGLGRVIGSRITGVLGVVRDLPERDRAHGVVAWHPDFQLRGQRLIERRIELSLPAVRHLQVRVDPCPVAQEWLGTCEVSVHFRCIPDGNPVRRGPDYLEERVLAHLGLEGRDWPVGDRGCRIPCYLDADAWVELRSEPTLPNRLLGGRRTLDEQLLELAPYGHGLRPAPRGVGGRSRGTKVYYTPADRARRRAARIRVDRIATAVRIAPEPKSAHAVVLRHLRRPGDRGEAWLHLHHVPTRRSFMAPYSAFEDRGGDLRFSVFGLTPGKYRPSLVFRDGDEVKRVVDCEGFDVRGRCEYRLVPVRTSGLELRVAGAVAGETIEVELRHADRLPVGAADRAAGAAFTWSALRPGGYTVRARSGARRAFDRRIELRPGSVGSVELELRATCKVTLVTAGQPAGLRIRDLASGTVRRKSFVQWDPIHAANASPVKQGRGFGQVAAFELPYGTYEFATLIRKRTVRRTVVLDRPEQRVRLD